MGAETLTISALRDIPDAQGFYQLFNEGELVYIRKTDEDAGLRRSLGLHPRRIQHRHNIDPKNVLFKAIRVFIVTIMDLESQLLKHYGVTSNLPWNGSGFGSNDPGRNRDKTV